MAELTADDVRALRMRALLLAGEHAHASVGDVVTWMGAMQAQDYASGLWSLGIRLPGSTRTQVEAALEAREALRTWPMRGTVHLVPSRDARWMLELMSGKPLAGTAARREYLGITSTTVETANAALAAALGGGGRLTRSACMEVIQDAGIDTSGQVGYHLLWYTSQTGVTCIGPQEGTEQTFALLNEWVPDPVALDRDEALATIALRFVRSHGPVTIKDLSRWTGLGMRECRAGIAGAGDALVAVDTELGPMMAATAALEAGVPADAGGHVIPPGFDEYMLGYADRTAALAPDLMKAVVPGSNGVFRATLVRDGRVVGTWKRTTRARSQVVAVEPLARLTAADRRAFEAAFARYGAFMGVETEMRWAGR